MFTHVKVRKAQVVGIIAAVVFVVMSSCNNQKPDNTTVVPSEEEIVQSLKFQTLEEQLQNVPETHLHKVALSTGERLQNGSLKLIIVTIDYEEYGLKKHDCNKGFGLCYAKVRNPFQKLMNAVNGNNANEAKNSVVVQKDYDGNTFIELLLTENVSSEFLPYMPFFEIEEDLNCTLERNVYDLEDIFLVKGSYPFNAQLGEYGGYRVAVRCVENN